MPSLSLANFFSPMPETRIRSSGDLKGPFAFRSSMIARAVASPTPGSVFSASASATLMFTGPGEDVEADVGDVACPERCPASLTAGELASPSMGTYTF